MTGASRGLGRATARSVAAEGGHVIALARTQGGLEELDDDIRADGAGAATLVCADITDGDALDRLGAAIYERWGKLDGLVAAAGVLGVLSPVGHIKPQVWEQTVGTNLTANFRLIRAMDPLLRASEAGRAVFITAPEASAGKAYWSAYAATKAGLNALVAAYAAETRAADTVAVRLFTPPPLATALRAKAYPGENPDDLPAPDATAADILSLLDPAQRPVEV